ncbi:sulfite exporter TauE/SafE family protein [Kiloniella laminariae]|uniref:Probable membrane transporter protein n=1 Tax=Kiloniella laminariae TaxID=454162 RepID=A0ABT4LFG7_9PROT|nr:sulfite exporter TauE/SafE family protein [Kiloniella laminariae]MCZ4279845.1 sulfite exporter TauE/SafE family protein [Kiloniella laminariae]
MEILIYILVGISSFFFVIVPITGGVVLNPLLSLIVDPHTAVSITVFFFMINSGIKALIFRHDIVWELVARMLPVSIIAAVVGSYLIGFIPEIALYIMMLLMTLFFASKRIFPSLFRKKQDQKNQNYGSVITSILSGFMQGVGLGGGGSLRKVYFLSGNLSLQQMHGTTSALSLVLGTAATFIRLETDQVTFDILLPVLYLIPLMVISIVYGKKVLVKLSERASDIIIRATLALTVVFLTMKLL